MAIEVIYLWRALPFCGEEVRRQLLEVLQVPLPPEAQPFHHALCAWLTGGVLNSMQRFAEAERVRVCGSCGPGCAMHADVSLCVCGGCRCVCV